MMILLDVPFAEKDEAKALGAKWNPALKRWYVQKRTDYYKFLKWVLFKTNNGDITIICDHFYIIESLRTCYKCKNETPVISFGIENYATFDYEDYYDENNELYEELDSNYQYSEDDFIHSEINIMPSFSPVPENLATYLKEHHNYFPGYSKFTASTYMANHCKFCNSLQGHHFLFSEPDSPFYIDSENSASKLILYKIPLKYDFAVSAEIMIGSEDYLIKTCAKKILLDFDTAKF